MYEVLCVAMKTVTGREMVTIRVFGTGEVLDYPQDEMITDPEAV